MIVWIEKKNRKKNRLDHDIRVQSGLTVPILKIVDSCI